MEQIGKYKLGWYITHGKLDYQRWHILDPKTDIQICKHVQREWGRIRYADHIDENDNSICQWCRWTIYPKKSKYTPDTLRERNKRRHAEWTTANRERFLVSRKRWFDKLREDTFQAYGRKCACCGETEILFLTLDHVYGQGSSHRRSLHNGKNIGGLSFYAKLRKAGYPQDIDLQVLCANCHHAKSAGGCPHQLREDQNEQ